MNSKHDLSRRRGLRLVGRIVMVLAVVLLAPLGYAAWEYTTWRAKMIEWDCGTIERLCGGDTREDRLLEIRFVREWEYKALKRTPGGNDVWMHWKLSKRHCGNWTLLDPRQYALIRPYEVRFPNGAPDRSAVSCLGVSVDENENYKRRDEIREALRRRSSEASQWLRVVTFAAPSRGRRN